ncbi:MAG: MBOAT family protein [Myxococcales bacterium]|nr:MBOAT family protein [Myxococcales bacterium]
MLFPSREFLFYFLPILLAVYYLIPNRARRLWLAVGSYFFYGWWNPRYIPLLLVSTLLNYYAAMAIARLGDRPLRRTIYVAAIVANLGLLGFFKYFMFANRSLAELFGLVGATYPESLLRIEVLLPIGISFFTFQAMSYTIDVYRGKVGTAAGLIDFACFKSLFPQLIAGPIVRYTDLADQLRHPRFSWRRTYAGLTFFILGLAKKVLLADNISPLVNRFFDATDLAGFGAVDAITATIAYSLQIYFDFSGYSDMAVGLGYFLGYQFPQNFNSPYKSVDISEFWRRWHMTLSYFLRDYLYIALGGSRGGRWRTYRNLALTMLLGGLWHGANWTFVVWGAWHGAWLVIERLAGKRYPLRHAPRVVRIGVTYGLACLGWIFFRAKDLSTALAVFGKLGDWRGGGILLTAAENRLPLLMSVLGLVLVFGLRNTWELKQEAGVPRTLGLIALFLLCLVFLFGMVTHPFLYFQF